MCVPVSNNGFYNNAEGNPGSSGALGSSGCDVPIVSLLLPGFTCSVYGWKLPADCMIGGRQAVALSAHWQQQL